MFDNSLSNIAKDTIVRKNPFPHLDLMGGMRYACKWGLTDLYPDCEEILRKAIDERKVFDTGWCDCKKEIHSFRIISNGEIMTIQASAEMDDIPELFYDALNALDDDTELTEAQISELEDYWYEDTELQTYTTVEDTIPVTTYEDAIKTLSKLENSAQKQLDDWFEIVKIFVKDVVDATKEE